MKPHPPFYVCESCGLSVHKLEVEKAYRRARSEMQAARGKSDEERADEKRKKRREYLDWFMNRRS